MTDVDTHFEEWALMELLGRRQLAGRVTSVEIAGKGFLRIDVFGKPHPGEQPTLTQFISPGSVYAMTPMTEAMARRFAMRHTPQPVTRWELAPADPPVVDGEIVEVRERTCDSCDTILTTTEEIETGFCEDCWEGRV